MKGKSLKVKVVTVFTVIFAVLALISAFSDLLLKTFLSSRFNVNTTDAGSTGIIGGADGPTAIFVSGSIPSGWITAFFALPAVLGIIYLIFARYKKSYN